MAVHFKHVEAVREMLRAGADSNTRPWGGETPLLGAVRSNSMDIVRDLLHSGPDPTEHEAAFGKYTPLHYAADFNHPQVTKALLQAGALETAIYVNDDIPSYVIGVIDKRETFVDMDRSEKAYMQRLLDRGPAVRTRSWLWPVDLGAEGTGQSTRRGLLAVLVLALVAC